MIDAETCPSALPDLADRGAFAHQNQGPKAWDASEEFIGAQHSAMTIYAPRLSGSVNLEHSLYCAAARGDDLGSLHREQAMRWICAVPYPTSRATPLACPFGLLCFVFPAKYLDQTVEKAGIGTNGQASPCNI
ncbi:hypothetical protein EVG20_g6461 [Dentipellis fragilis]|uniref:Uncharacterized protein n=1 Tax=Dentipellis fragilis TaxID=205917 RepID=A0A4Y9YLR9_9AGAM|nr:hypothetical protein EVG20_g6461 [Dentipellis fragilis]